MVSNVLPLRIAGRRPTSRRPVPARPHRGRASGAGVGASFMDGLVRFDVARGIYPEKKIRANLYVEARF